jgi:hypothetical protein
MRSRSALSTSGVELDHIGNLGVALDPLIPIQPPSPPDADIRAEIDRLYNKGVRYIFPLHLVDNPFGGAAAYESLFDVSSLRESGHPYDLVCAQPDQHPEDKDIRDSNNGGFTYDNSGLNLESWLAQIGKTGFAVVAISAPKCPPGVGHKNSLALTQSGQVAMKEMMRLGMLIDIDHMSQATADGALTLAKQFSYPVNSGHNSVRCIAPGTCTERSMRADQYQTIGLLHGMAGVGGAGLAAPQWMDLYNSVIQAMEAGAMSFPIPGKPGSFQHAPIAAGFGTDTNGLAFGMAPRGPILGPGYQAYQTCVKKCIPPLPAGGGGKPPPPTNYYACVNACGNPPFINPVQYSATFPASTDGNKTWDYNKDGVAHYGMLWDFIEDVRTLPGGADIVDNSLMHGADYFWRTWQIAEQQSSNPGLKQ